MTLEQQRQVLDHTYKQLTDFCGKPPVGSVAPWWEASKEGIELLLEKGIEYDHSSQAHDCMPFYTRDEDTWTKIDFKAGSAHDWMHPLKKGKLTKLVNIPANWYLGESARVSPDRTGADWQLSPRSRPPLRDLLCRSIALSTLLLRTQT